jgi:RHS repeat-associated protein
VTPRLITDETGVRMTSHTYWPFGRKASDPSQNSYQMKYTGHERDAYDESSTSDDLDSMHARFYNPIVARFMSVDPLAGSIAAPQSLNRYAYVMGNPLRYRDPRGLEEDEGEDKAYDIGFGEEFTTYGKKKRLRGPITSTEDHWKPLPPLEEARDIPALDPDRRDRFPEWPERKKKDDPEEEPFDDPQVKDFAACLLERASFGHGGMGEWGGSARRLSDGSWLFNARTSGGRRHVTFKPLEEARFLLHTHPYRDVDGPSAADMDVAKDRLIPSYVVKKNGVWKFTPSPDGRSGSTDELAGNDWFKQVPEDPCSRVRIYKAPPSGRKN